MRYTRPTPKSRNVFPILGFALFIMAYSGCSDGCAEPQRGPVSPQATSDSSPADGAQEPTEADEGDMLVSGSIGDIINLIPFLSSDAGSHEIASLVYDSLLSYDEELNFKPLLAESWEISEDQKSITFHLRKGVVWEDGDPFDVKDVELTFQAMIHPDSPNPYAEDYLRVDKFEVVDSHTFRVSYSEVYAPSMDSWTNFMPLPSHILSKHFSPTDNRIVESPLKDHPVANGAYSLVEWVRDQYVLLKRNETYYRGPMKIGKYQYRVIADTSTMFNELRAGGLDEMGLTPQQYTHQANGPEFKKRFNHFSYLARGYSYMGFNLEHRFFKDKKIRQAISYAINKKDIIDGVFLGQAVAATGPYVPQTRWHNPNVKGYEYSPQKARDLLTEAGWSKKDDDGYLVNAKGERFAFTLITNAGNDVRAAMATVIQSNLKDVGIHVEIRTLEWATFLKEFINKLNYDAFILGWSLGLEPDQFLIWHSSKAKPGELNHVMFRNDEADRLLEAGRRELNSDKRQEYYWKLQEILSEEAPYVFLAVGKANVLVDKRFRGVRSVPLRGVGYSFNENEWWVPQALHKYK